RIKEIVTGVATAMGCEAEIESVQLTPPVFNDASVNARLRDLFGQAKPDLNFIDDHRTMGAEDMSIFLNAVPGSYIFVGSAYALRGLDYPHQHPKFDFNEDVLPIGAGLLATAVADYVIKT